MDQVVEIDLSKIKRNENFGLFFYFIQTNGTNSSLMAVNDDCC
jgi:hypothetical protein